MSKCGVFSGPYFPVFRLNTEIYRVNLRFSLSTVKYGPEKTEFEYFSCSDGQTIHARHDLNFLDVK